MKQRLTQRLLSRAQTHWPYALGATLLWCAMLPLAGVGRAAAAPLATARDAPEWPLEWRGQALRPLARSPVEARFAQSFPGRIARFALADSGDELVLRDVDRPTRMLHPAADCWRGIGEHVAGRVGGGSAAGCRRADGRHRRRRRAQFAQQRLEAVALEEGQQGFLVFVLRH